MALRLALCCSILTACRVESQGSPVFLTRLRTGGDAMGAPVIIGSSLALDCCSNYAAVARQYYYAWEMAIQWITEQRGGIRIDGPKSPPRPLELVVYNDHSNASIVNNVFTEMVQSGISILLAPYSAELTEKAADIANKTGALMMATGSSSAKIFRGRPTVFGTLPPADAFCAEAWKAILPTTRRVATIRSAPQCAGVASQAQIWNLTVTLDASISSSPNPSLFAELVRKLKEDTPDSMFLCLYPQQCRDFVVEMERQKLNLKAAIFAICFTDSSYWDMGELPLFVTGLTPYMPSFPTKSELTNFTAKAFADRVYKQYGFFPGYQAVSGWIGILALVEAIERAQSLNVSEIAAQLSKMSIQTEQGELSFDNNRQNTVSVKGVQMFAANQYPELVFPTDLQQRSFYYPMPVWSDRSCLSTSSSDLGFFNGVCDYCPQGYISTWVNTTSQRLCKLCPLGTETRFDFVLKVFACSQCPPGRAGFRSGQIHICLACDPGTYTTIAGLSKCTQCPIRTFQNLHGQTTCIGCEPGHFSNAVGLSWCSLCPRNTFQDEPEQFDCKPCAANRITLDSGAFREDMCVCGVGFHDLTNSTSSFCQECPEGVVCPGGGGNPSQANGYWVDFTDSWRAVVKCRLSDYCPPGTFGKCAANRIARACDSCKFRTFPSSLGPCEACENTASTPVQVTLVVSFSLFILTGVYWLAGGGTRIVRGSVKDLWGVVNVFLLALQGLYAIGSLHIKWVEPLATLVFGMSFLQVRTDVIRPTCFMDLSSPLAAFVISLSVVPIMMLYVLLVHVIRYFRVGRASIWQLRSTLGRVAWITYLPVFLLCISPFRCISNPVGPESLLEYRSLACWSGGSHVLMVIVGAIAIAVFPLPMLLLAIYSCWQLPRKIVRNGGVRFLEYFDFFFQNFHGHRYYFVLVVMLRNAGFALTPAVITEYAQVHIIVMALILLLYMIAQVYLMPWRGGFSNVLDIFMCFTLMVVALLGSALCELGEHTKREMFVHFVICGLSVSGFALLFFCARLCYYLCTPWKTYVAFLSHHKGGAAVLARFFKEVLSRLKGGRVFLDCDDLSDLKCISEVVSEQTQTVVSLITHEYFRRMWCAVELVTAFKCHVRIIPVECDDHCPITKEWLACLDSVWNPSEWSELQANGCAIHSIRETYQAIVEMEFLPFKQKVTLQRKLDFLDMLSCRLDDGPFGVMSRLKSGMMQLRSAQRKVSSSGSILPAEDAQVLITGAVSDAEGLCTCHLLQLLLQEALEQPIATVRSGLEVDLASDAGYLVIVLTPGVLADWGFAHVLMVSKHLPTIPVLATKLFSFPTTEFYGSLISGQVFSRESDIDLETLASLYKTVFTILSVEFQATASREVLLLELDQLAKRFHFIARSRTTTPPKTSRELAHEENVRPVTSEKFVFVDDVMRV